MPQTLSGALGPPGGFGDASRSPSSTLKTNAQLQSVNRIHVASMLRLHRVERRPARILFGFQRPGRRSTRCKPSMEARWIRLTDCSWAFVFSVDEGDRDASPKPPGGPRAPLRVCGMPLCGADLRVCQDGPAAFVRAGLFDSVILSAASVS